MKLLLTALALVFGCNTLCAQDNSIAGYHFLEGTWKGNGWTLDGTKKIEFRETETITLKLGGKAIQLEAFGTDTRDSNTIVTDALGILAAEPATGKILLRIFQSGSAMLTADVKLLGPGEMEWSAKPGTVTIRYVIKVNGKNWQEDGYVSDDGSQWKHTFHMLLNKQ